MSRPGIEKEALGALLLLGRAYRDKGDYEIAFNRFEQTLELARELNDPALMTASHLSIAILRGVEQERYPEALPHLDESYKIDQSLGARNNMGYDQMNRGAFLWRLGRYQEARDALDLAFRIANEPNANFKTVLAWVHLTDSQMALSQRHLDDAKAKSQQALDIAGTEYRDVALQAKFSLGLAQALSGAAQQARKPCEEAVATAKELKSPRHLSSALLALAEVLLLANTAPGALATALEAQSMFAHAGQQDSDGELCSLRLAPVNSPNKLSTQDYASRANGLCAGLQEKWGAEAYDGYLRRPDIETYRRQIDQILSRSSSK
jgi:tetratricopeptide (TPR) repeat protein